MFPFKYIHIYNMHVHIYIYISYINNMVILPNPPTPPIKRGAERNAFAVPAIHFFGFPGWRTLTPPFMPFDLFEAHRNEEPMLMLGVRFFVERFGVFWTIG